MNGKAHGQLRRSQVITTFGPGALIDLPNESAIVGGLDTWGAETNLEPIDEPRLAAKLTSMTGVHDPRLYTPPSEPEHWQDRQRGIGAWRFPEWFVVQESNPGSPGQAGSRSRRMVRRTALDRGRFDKRPVVATRFVRACSRGHVDDIDWHRFVHGPEDHCRRQLRLDERGTSGDLAEQIVRCECGKSRRMHEATDMAKFPLGTCSGARPWLGRHANEPCDLPSRLLIRTASNAWFPQVLSVLSLPDRGTEVDEAVEELWQQLQIVNDLTQLSFVKQYPGVAGRLATFSDDEVLDAIAARRSGGAGAERPIKYAELDALLAVPEGFGDDVPVDPDFHARRLPESVWRRSTGSDGIASVIQVHRLREVLALAGFTRLEPVMPNVDGEYESEVERADIALEPTWFPAVENRGEGIVMQLRGDAVMDWLGRDAVQTSAEPAHRRPSRLGASAEQRAALSRRSLRAAAHAVPPSDPIAIDALRLPRRVDPGAHLRGLRGQALRSVAVHREPGRRRHAGWAGPGSASRRRPPEVRTRVRRAVLQRSGLRRARTGAQHGGALAARGGVPRLHTDRGNFL